MRPDRPSATAMRVAAARAAHQLDDPPRVLDDPIALPILGPEVEARVRRGAGRRSTYARAVRAFIVARSRRAEDALAEAVARGVDQYVVLGAGLDTFAYRNPFPAGKLRVFEVDYPATQEWKRRRLVRAEIRPPASLTYVAVDFEAQALMERLVAAGFRADRPAFFSWLGVTMYLRRETVLATLRDVAALPAGSGITFDYFAPPHHLPWVGRIAYRFVAWRVARGGEPWRATFEPEDLARELGALGFTRLEDLDHRAINARYFESRVRHLGGRGVARIMTAFR